MLKADEVMNLVLTVAADELQNAAESAAPGIHTYGRRLDAVDLDLYAVNVMDDLWLRSDSKFAKGDPRIAIGYLETAKKYDVSKIVKEILAVIKRHAKPVTERLKRMNSDLPNLPKKPPPPRGKPKLRSV